MRDQNANAASAGARLASLVLAYGGLALASAGFAQAIAPAPAFADEAALYQSAKAEGQVVWYTTLIYDTAVRPLISAFEKTYPGVHVAFSRADSVPTALKIITESKAGKPQADVFDGTETVEPLIHEGYVEKYIPPNDGDYPAQVRDPAGYWRTFILYFLTPAVNTELVPADQRPKTAEDLLDPKWKGRIAWNTSASTGAQAFIAGILQSMGEDKGMAYLRALAKQGVINVDATARAMVDKVAEGEYPLALSIFNHHTVMDSQKGAPVTWLKMDPIVASLSMTGLVKNAPHPAAARLFIDFLLSKPTQQLFADLGFLPAMPSVAAKDPTLKPEQGGFQPIYLTPDQVQIGAPKWQAVYKELFR